MISTSVSPQLEPPPNSPPPNSPPSNSPPLSPIIQNTTRRIKVKAKDDLDLVKLNNHNHNHNHSHNHSHPRSNLFEPYACPVCFKVIWKDDQVIECETCNKTVCFFCVKNMYIYARAHQNS